MKLNVCVAGVTGWAGHELARGVATTPDLTLASGVSRTKAGTTLAELFANPHLAGPVCSSAAEALQQPCDVFVEYTTPEFAKSNILLALSHGAHVVVGTSGLTNEDYAEINDSAKKRGLGVLACGNFALTAVLLMKFSAMAAKHLSQWEIIEYANDTKKDVPSGTVRELAVKLAEVRRPEDTLQDEQLLGYVEARGAILDGNRVHALRLPGFTLGVDVVFGSKDQSLVLRHTSGNSAAPYVEGAILAIRKVSSLVGLHRGLESILDF